ncbi:MAG: MarR family transcriptional regulator [Rhizobiaceae bacterium]|nr:MarR family transcriptional regulator [Rhizobiaceae bacterium]
MAGNETMAMIDRLARIAAHDAHTAGLKPVQWEALRFLARANRFSRTPGALTAYLGATKGTVSQTLIALERAGYIDKSTDTADRRTVRLALTAAGRERLTRDGTEPMERALGSLNEADRRALTNGAAALLRARIAIDGGRPFGICRDCRHFAHDAGGLGQHFCRLLKVPLAEADTGKICIEQEAA